jgi:hypothetical protein
LVAVVRVELSLLVAVVVEQEDILLVGLTNLIR